LHDQPRTSSSDGMITLLSSEGRGWQSVQAQYCQVPAGRTKVPRSEFHRVSLHFGTAVNASCRCDGRVMHRVQSQGDADVIPAGLEGEWEDDASCTILRMYIARHLVREAADTMGCDGDRIDLAPRFQLRDRRIEYIGWALKEELSADTASAPSFAEGLARALAARIVHNASVSRTEDPAKKQVLSPRQLRGLQDFIEGNIGTSLTLKTLAAVVGMSISHLSTLFRQTTGMSLHQYVIKQRIERAKQLLIYSQISVSEVALEVGFANQSHLSRSMRRVMGVSPGMVVRSAR